MAYNCFPRMPAKRMCLRGCAVLVVSFIVVMTILLLIALLKALAIKERDHYKKIEVDGVFKLIDEKRDYYLDVFAKSLRFNTTSRAPGDYNRDELMKFQEYLIRSFPVVFNNSDTEKINNFSLLLHFQGTNRTLSPYMLCAHSDVVPVNPLQWKLPPFLGEIVKDPETGEDYVWGRGAIDVKSVLVGILSALDILLTNGWKPQRSFYIAFGHDEEVSGFDGAGHISKFLSARGVSLDFVLDEGISFTKGVLKQVKQPLGLICVTEKGRMDVRLTVRGPGGHSSIPPKDQAVQKLANAITNLYDNPHPSKFGSALDRDMLMYLAPKVSFLYKIVFGNIWLFGPAMSYVLSLKTETDALLRTTTAATIVRAGLKENVVPSSAWANINHRVHPSQTLEEVLAHDKTVIDDGDVELEVMESVAALPVSSYGQGTPYHLIAEVIHNVFPEVVTAPGTLVGNTDTRHYVNIAKNMYRMLPFILTPSDIKTIHSNNERLSVKNFVGGIEFYKTLILRADKDEKMSFNYDKEL